MSYYPPPQRVVEKRGANHGLHLVLTLITCGVWAITGWPIAAIMGRKKTVSYAPPPPQIYGQPPYGQYPPAQQYPPGQYPPTP